MTKWISYSFWFLLALLIVQRIVVLCTFNAEWTDSDQTVFWVVAKDYSEFHFRQPFLYGQDYGYAIESILAIPLLWCKVPYYWALPIVTNILAIAPFVSFAFWFRRKQQFVSAILFLAIPLLLPISYSLITSMPRGFVNGVAVFALWPLAERINKPAVRYLLFGVILLGAPVINPNSVFLSILLGCLAFYQAERKAHATIFMIVGASIPATIHLCALNWVSNHSTELVHHSWEIHWNADYFFQTFKDTPYAFFRGVLPFTETCGLYTIWILPAIAVYAVWKKKYSFAFLALALTGAIIWSLSVNKVSDGGLSVFFPRSRMFLSLPLVLALLLAAVLAELRMKSLVFALAAVCGIYCSIQFFRLKSVVDEEAHTNEFVPVQIASLNDVKYIVDEIARFSSANSVKHIAANHNDDFTIGRLQLILHAGECMQDSFPVCAIPEYERRPWKRAEVLGAPASTTLWLGASEEQWQKVDSAIGNVNTVEIVGVKFHRVQQDNILNKDVYHVMRVCYGLPE